MIILEPALAILGIGFLCWLVFTLAVYALPFFVGLTAGMAACHSGAGIFGGIVVGFVAGAVTLGLGQLAFASIPSALVRAGIALLFAVPATIAGYHATLGLAHIAVPSPAWREIFSIVGAICIGCTAFVRMAAMALPPALGQAASPEPIPPRLTGATGQGSRRRLSRRRGWRSSGRSHSVYLRDKRCGDLDGSAAACPHLRPGHDR